MSGVFRAPGTDEYRYYGWNDYEERRLRDWDDRYGYGSYQRIQERPLPTSPTLTFAPIPAPAQPPPAPAPAPAWLPGQAWTDVPVSTLKLPTQVVFDTGAMKVLSPDFVPVVASWEGPTPQTAVAVPAQPFNFEEFQEKWNTAPRADVFEPPARVGQNPEFDAIFDRLTAQGQSISYERLNNDLLVASF
jgi:hypothetical protein